MASNSSLFDCGRENVSEDVSEDIAGQIRELEHFGNPPRFDIRMYPLYSVERPPFGVTILANSRELREVVASIGYQFKREIRYDFPPFDPSSQDEHGVLFSSQRFLATFAIAAGAAGFSRPDGVWCMDWIWIHPYERGGRLMRTAWQDLEREYGSFRITGPYSPAMVKFLRHSEVSADRLDAPLEDG